MNRKRQIVGMFLLFVAMLAIPLVAVAATGKDQQRPFKGKSHGVVTAEGFIEGSECPFMDVFTEGSGIINHMGRVTIERHHCFTPPDHPEFNGSVIHDGSYEMTAVNGDKIWGTYSGELQPTEFGEDGPIRGIITAPSTIDGGTGRFANAQGHYLTTGDYDLIADEGDFIFLGWIDY